MTEGNVLDGIIKHFPPVAAAVLLIAAAVIFLAGFSRRGMNFIKYGFGQTTMDSSLEKRFDNLVLKWQPKKMSQVCDLSLKQNLKL